MSYMRTTAYLTLSDVKESYEKYHTDVDDIAETIVKTEAKLIASDAIKWGAACIGSAVVGALAGAYIFTDTAVGIWTEYCNSKEAEKYAQMLKLLGATGPSGYIKAKLYIIYEDRYIPYEGTKRKIYSVIVENWGCYSDGSVIV